MDSDDAYDIVDDEDVSEELDDGVDNDDDENDLSDGQDAASEEEDDQQAMGQSTIRLHVCYAIHMCTGMVTR